MATGLKAGVSMDLHPVRHLTDIRGVDGLRWGVLGVELVTAQNQLKSCVLHFTLIWSWRRISKILVFYIYVLVSAQNQQNLCFYIQKQINSPGLPDP